MDNKESHSKFTGLIRENHDTIRRITGYHVDDYHEQKDLYQEIVSQL